MIGNIAGMTNEQLKELRKETEAEWAEDSTIDAYFAMPKLEREAIIDGYRKLIAEIDAELNKRSRIIPLPGPKLTPEQEQSLVDACKKAQYRCR